MEKVAHISTSSQIADHSRLDTKENLDKAAAEFESIFIQMMIKAGRKASLGDDLFGGHGSETFRDMQDEMFAEAAAKRGGFGIAEALKKYFSESGTTEQEKGSNNPDLVRKK